MSARKHKRQSIRLQDYDYSQPGYYFVTISARNKKCLFGDILNGQMVLNEIGRIIAECWQWLPKQYAYVDLDEWVIMPDHLHGIIIIAEKCRGGSRTAPTLKRKPLGRLMGAFKTVSTKEINTLRSTPASIIWQRNYFERVIRDENELHKIREYIQSNPKSWDLNPENPYAKT